MDPSLSMNAISGHIDLNEMERRAKVAEAQRATLAAPQDAAAQYHQAQYERIAAPTLCKPIESYPEYMQRRSQEAAVHADRAREAKEEILRLGALPGVAHGVMPKAVPDRAVTFGEMCSGTDGRGDCEYKTGHAGPHSPGVPPSSLDGQRLNGLGLHRYQGLTQQLRAPGKMFSRTEILAILRSRVAMANGMAPGSARQNELADLIQIFENLE